MPFSAAKIHIICIITFQMTLPVRMMWYQSSRSTISKMNKRVSIVEPLPGWEDKEAVIDNRLSIVMPKRIKMWMKWHDNLDFSSEAGDLFHKLEVKEISRESVSWNHDRQFEKYEIVLIYHHPHHHHHHHHHVSQAKPSSHTLYFSDGARRIDMILVYEVCTKRVFSSLLTYLGIIGRLFWVKYSHSIFLSLQTDTENTKKTHARESFEKHLQLQGLETETENKSVSVSNRRDEKYLELSQDCLLSFSLSEAPARINLSMSAVLSSFM